MMVIIFVLGLVLGGTGGFLISTILTLSKMAEIIKTCEERISNGKH